MYYRYFGLNDAPFSIAVNPRYLFMSARHREALAHLLYGVGAGGGFVLLTGEVGTGKTTIIRSLLEQLPDNTDIALIFNPSLDAKELLAAVCDELKVAYSPQANSLKNLTDNLHRFLLDNHARGRNTVLLIDEAQHLKVDVLEQVRLLTNLETNTKKLLQIILVGQPELRSLLNKPELRQLAQRITARYQLKPLNLQETGDYIRHRLQVAGLPATQTLFPAAIVKAIHRASRGVPRIINVLCDRMLLGTYGQHKSVVNKTLFKLALAEVVGEEGGLALAANRSNKSLLAALLVVAVVIAGLLLWPRVLPLPTEAVVPVPTATAEITATPTPAAVSDQTPSWFLDEAEAIAELRRVIGEPGDNTCDNTDKAPLRCERLTAQSWQELQSYNRPAVIRLITPAKMLRFGVLLGWDNEQAYLSVNGVTQTTQIEALGKQWSGEFLLFWQANADYRGPLTRDDRGPMVNWLGRQFATLDQQSSTLANDRFTAALQQRVILFQRANALNDDGVVGLKTLLKLNEQLAAPVTLIHEPPDADSSSLPDAVSDTSGGEG